MLETVSRTAVRFYNFYCNGIASWYENIGPKDYVFILCASLLLGYLLLRSTTSRSY